MNKPGRPPLDRSDPSVPLTVALPSKQYAALLAHAKAERATLAELVRRLLTVPAAGENKKL